MARKVFLAGVLAALIGVTACSGSPKSVSTGAGATTTSASTTSSSSTIVMLPPTTATTVGPPPVVSTTKPTQVPTTRPSSTTTTAKSGAKTFQVTSADHYLAVKVGDTVEITLSSNDMVWSQVDVSPTDLVRFLPVHSPPANGQYLGLTAAAAGTVTVTSSARPLCGIGVACPMFVMEWSFTLVIS